LSTSSARRISKSASRAVDDVAVEVGEVAVEPVAVGLHQAFEGDFGIGDDIDRHLRARRGRDEQAKRAEDGEGQGAAGEVHGEPFGRGGEECRAA
jgi:hypothetical protein